MATGYKFPYKGGSADIADIAVPGHGGTPDPCVYFGEAGFRTDNKTGLNDNKFLAVNNDDKWKTGIGMINYYSSNKTGALGLTRDIASKYSCPNFKKVIGFYGDGAQPDPTAKKVFKRYVDSKGNTIYRTYRLRIKMWNNDDFLISIDEKATNGNVTNVGQWHLKSKTGTLPTALIVGIQAAGGNGGEGAVISGGGHTYMSGGAGGGAGACCFVVLDWITAAKKVTYGDRTDYVLFDFYITPIDIWKEKAYPDDKSTTKCDCDCVTITLNDGFYSNSEVDIKSKIIIGCGQSVGKDSNGHETIPGKAGIIMNYDLGDDRFGIAAGKVYEEDELSKYGIHILKMHPVGTATENANAGKGGNSSYTDEKGAGYSSIHYWLVPTNCGVDENQYASMAPNEYIEQLYKKEGGAANGFQYGGTGGGGASNYAKGGNGGATSASSNGDDGTLGSGGGGGFYQGSGGKGGLPYIFFCSNMDFLITAQ